MTVKPLVEASFAWIKDVQSAGRLSKGKTLEGISINSAKSSAIIYSITEAAKANNLNPFRF